MFELILPWITKAVTIITMLASLRAWWIARKQAELQRIAAQLVQIQVSDGTHIHVFAYSPRRSQLSRAELLGIIGMEVGGGRFTLNLLTEIFTGGAFERVLNGTSSILSIPCSEEEMEQFYG